MPHRGARGLLLPALLTALLAAALRLPAPARAWRPDNDLDLDLDLDHDHDLDLDHDFELGEDDGDAPRKERPRPRRVRLPSRMGDDDEWNADFEKMLQSEAPWGRGLGDKESYEDFVKKFSSDAPVDEHELERLDDWE